MSHDKSTNGTNTRRRILNWIAGLSITSFLVALLTPLKDLALAVKKAKAGGEGGESGQQSGIVGNKLVFAQEFTSESGKTYSKGEVITADKLKSPEGTLAFPKGKTKNTNLVLLHKFKPENIKPPTKKELTDQGFVGYSGICTHLGCTVSYTDKPHQVGSPHDHCPCHVGEFDPYEGATVVSGPPPRPLPQLGVEVNENGEIVVSEDFEAEVGGE